MNIVYINTHDTGRWIEPYGFGVVTPNLRQLAEEGILFRQAFCTSPNCSPSRAALLTGMTPHSNGMTGLTHRGFRLNDYSNHLASFLKGHGYDTVLCGFQHEDPNAESVGYQRVLTVDGDKTDAVNWDLPNAFRAAEFLKEKKNKPFLLTFGMFSTHRPFPQADPNISPKYVPVPSQFPDHPDIRGDMSAFMTSLSLADRCVGIVLEAIKEAGLEEDTLILFTTDHGIPFPGMKFTLYDSGLGVSLIMKIPGLPVKGSVSDALVSHLDLFPTICDLLRLDKPSWLQGNSLLPLFKGEAASIRDALFGEMNFHGYYTPARCIRTAKYKYIKYFTDTTSVLGQNGAGASPTWDYMVEHGYCSQDLNTEMLFDLSLDPMERVNRVSDQRLKEVYIELSDQLTDWMKQTNDPLLAGDMPRPPGINIKE